MIIGLDIDGTITEHPPFFSLISRALIGAGHEVVIITFRQDRASAVADLEAWGIAYSQLITWWPRDCDAVDMLAWKGTVCRELGVEMYFDDDPDVLDLMERGTLGVRVINPERPNGGKSSGV